MSSAVPTPRRLRAPAARPPRRRPLTRTSLALGLTVFFTLIGTTFAAATWTAPASTVRGTATAATSTATFTGAAELGFLYKETLSSSKPLFVTNTGTTPLSYSLTVGGITDSALAPNVNVTLWKSDNTSCAIAAPTSGATSGTLAALPMLPDGTASAPAGTSFTLCVATSLTGTVADFQGLTVSPILTMTGRVGTTWTTVSTAPAFTQSVYQIDAPVLNCDNGQGKDKGVTLSWPNVVGESARYTLIRVGDTEASAVILSDSKETQIELASTDVSTPSSMFQVIATEKEFGTTSPTREDLFVTITRDNANNGKILCEVK